MKPILIGRLCKFAWFGVVLVLSAVLQSPVCAVADPSADIPFSPIVLAASSLYNGEDISAAPFAAESWGAGTVDTIDYPGLGPDKKALKIETFGPYEGALLTFTTPGVLGNVKADKTRFLDIVLSVTSPSTITGSAAFLSNPLVHLAQFPAPARGQAIRILTDPHQARLILHLSQLHLRSKRYA